MLFSNSSINKLKLNKQSNTYDNLTLRKGDYILLLVNDSIYVELDSFGVYHTNNILIDNKVKINSSNQYIKYVVWQIQNGNKEYLNDRKPFFEKPIFTKQHAPLTIKLPPDSFLFGNSIILKFAENFFDNNFSYGQRFRVTGIGISNMEEDIFYQTDTNKKMIKIKSNDIMKYDGFFFNYVPLDNKNNIILNLGEGNHIIRNLSHANRLKYDRIKQEHSTLFAKSQNSLIQKLAEAYFFDKNELYMDATNSFEELMELGGDRIKEVVSFYNAFFERHK